MVVFPSICGCEQQTAGGVGDWWGRVRVGANRKDQEAALPFPGAIIQQGGANVKHVAALGAARERQRLPGERRALEARARHADGHARLVCAETCRNADRLSVTFITEQKSGAEKRNFRKDKNIKIMCGTESS